MSAESADSDRLADRAEPVDRLKSVRRSFGESAPAEAVV